ncbi:MAG: SHOCT domain-containing protein [Burkholderiaceae bacterium]|nr:SHOCT domain-containing protein [Burkholderiaceae bacterium]
MKRMKVSPRAASNIRLAGIMAAMSVLAACGTFQLASHVYPLTNQTQEQMQLDNLSCKDKARLEANTAERQAGAFALGLTIVGAPLAFELEKAKQREVYKACMEAKGYRVLPPIDDANSTATSNASAETQPKQAQSISQPTPAAPQTGQSASQSTPSAAPTHRGDEGPRLQKLKELWEKGIITEEEYQAKRKEILFSL